MNIKRICNCIVSMLCIVMLLGTSQVFALSSGKAPDGSVNIIPPDTAARLQLKVTGSGAKLSVVKSGSSGSINLSNGEPFARSARTGDEYQVNYKVDTGMNLEVTSLDGGKNASVYGDVDMKGDSASRFANKSSEGKFTIKLTGGHANFTIKVVNANEVISGADSSNNESDDNARSAESNIVMEGKFDNEAGRRGSVQNTNTLERIPESASYDNVSRRMTMSAGAAMPRSASSVRAMAVSAAAEPTRGTVTWHKQYKDNNRNHASIFKINIGGIIHDAVCADGKNFKTAEAGQAVTLAKQASDSLFSKFAYLASTDKWQKSNYSEKEYYFALVCAARRVNGRPAYERVNSRPLINRMMQDAKAYKGKIPENFKSYLAYPTNGTQMMLTWGIKPYGKIEVVKSIGNNIKIAGECKGTYSLAGAVYTVYDEAGTAVGKLTTDEKGRTGTLEVKPGKYTIKETTAPVGYELDKTVYKVESKAETTSTVQSYDSPVFAPVKIFLEKKASGDSYMNPSDMAGAEFEVKYYDTIGPVENAKAVRTWKLRTTKDASGKYTAELRDKNLVKGSDPLFITEQGDAVLPRGTVTIRETKAPVGYLLDKTVYTKKINGDGAGAAVYFNSGVPSSHVNNPAIPKIGTKAMDVATEDSIAMYGPKTKVKDVVSFSNLYEGETYTLEGVLMDKSTGRPIEQNGNKITSQKEFTVTAQNSTISDSVASGEVGLELTFDTTKLAGKNTVVFETLKYKGKEIANHRDISDDNQTLRHPEIKTQAHSVESGTNTGAPSKEEKIIDKVKYKNLIIGKKYKVTGVLMDKEKNKPFLDKDNKEITAEKEFTAEKADGEIELEFRYDSSLRQDKVTVVFETLTYRNVPVAVHADINDSAQSIYYPAIGTKITGKGGAKVISKAKNVSLVDTVKYENLISGRSYTVKGVLMDKKTGKPYEEDGKAVTGSTTFKSEGNGTAPVSFKLNTSKIAGKELVAYEKVYDEKGQLVATHEDINNRDQTIRIAQPTIPRTGDSSLLYMYLGLFLASFITLASLTAIKRCVRL
ncbi:VaFE repeat-containing surface-anchored protein [Mogibacterium pumilum]|uniref:Prealbumin-like fold domain-containing protein n=1 Tax=Mogibacterium pumilum TaxID=86332 RepID=A0A223AQD6_9FIRM|nr:VaFE repeat-containing surface-anchored protein [Mogibacterium pumilum]ASS37169.1 hypothetical protein AXF17_00870 [Mogibacterium pumilum]